MNKNILPVKGTHDLYGQEIDKFNYVVESFYSIATKFNFKSIQTPIIENQELFFALCRRAYRYCFKRNVFIC